jgi:hypothetical protein
MKIWLDDERPIPPGYDLHVRNEMDAIGALLEHGTKVVTISLDCDLGYGYGSGYNVALWITGQWEEGKLLDLSVLCHSGNPVERAAVLLLIKRAKERLRGTSKAS